MIYIGYDEIWKPITYENVARNIYEVSNMGEIRRIKDKKILKGNNPKNEKNYCRVNLKTIDGISKKFPIHRIVLYTFGDYDPDMEVNHIDGNKHNNVIFNLEKSSRKDNAKHASINNLYGNCDKHYASTFTNEEVHMICRYLEDGVSVHDIIKRMHFIDKKYAMSNIVKIARGKTWKKISSLYNIEYNKYHYKTYSYEDICLMCQCIFIKEMKNKDIVKLFPEYDSKKLKICLKHIRARRMYKDIVKNY